jgi:hypothetical protein
MSHLVRQRKTAHRLFQVHAQPDQIFAWLQPAQRPRRMIAWVKTFHRQPQPGHQRVNRRGRQRVTSSRWSAGCGMRRFILRQHLPGSRARLGEFVHVACSIATSCDIGHKNLSIVP